jgi:hypothetical protein
MTDYRERFFLKTPGARECSKLLDEASNWKLQYRLVRTRTPALQFEKLEAQSETQEFEHPIALEIRDCLEKGALKLIPIPAEIAVLSETQRDAQWIKLECHRVMLNLKQDELMEAKMRTPLMQVRIASLDPKAAGKGDPAGASGPQPWLERLWLAPYVDSRGFEQGWLESSLLPTGSCQLCLKDAWRDHEKPRP